VTALGATAGMAQQPPPAEGARNFFSPAPRRRRIASGPQVGAGQGSFGNRTASLAAGARHVRLGGGAWRGAPGLRYNLLLVSARGDRGQPVDPDRNFRKGDCVAVELEANRSGYLYVLSKQSSGDWVPLFPTPELSDQSNRIDPGRIVRTPKHACFEIDDPPGTETLFVVLSRDPRDIDELSESIKGPGDRPQPSSGPTQIAASGRINSAWDGLPSSMARATCRSGRLPSRLRRRRHLRDRRSRMSRSMRIRGERVRQAGSYPGDQGGDPPPLRGPTSGSWRSATSVRLGKPAARQASPRSSTVGNDR